MSVVVTNTDAQTGTLNNGYTYSQSGADRDFDHAEQRNGERQGHRSQLPERASWREQQSAWAERLRRE